MVEGFSNKEYERASLRRDCILIGQRPWYRREVAP